MSLTILGVAYPFAPVSRDAVGGAEQILVALDAALVAAGHTSLVIATQGSRVAGELLAVPAESGPIDEAATARAHARHRAAIAEALAMRRIDVVHLHGIDFSAYLPARGPTLVSLHLPLDWYPAGALSPDRPDLWLVPVSASQAARAPEGAELRAPIGNGVDIDALARRHARRDFALMLGRICPEKGVHIALDAAHRADVPLLIGGQVYPYRWHQDYFRNEVAPRLDRRRRFLGPLDLDRKRRLLNAARCLLVPSLCPETSSLVAMEAAACGTPVIAFANGALPDMVEEGVTGFLVGSATEMAAAIPRTAGLDRARIRARACARFGLERMIAGYFAAYEALAAGQKRSASITIPTASHTPRPPSPLRGGVGG